MKLFLDSADPKEIATLAATGLVDGVTTNPSLAAKTGQNLFDALKSICDLGFSSPVVAAFAEGAGDLAANAIGVDGGLLAA